ncbi:MAG: hypothetical protein IT392_12455 [Nitrospirae bacterium]|nr:hypothetical protein [Nitrospirota bacterium]
MENEKDKSTAITSEKSGTVSPDTDDRRPWHKPSVTRIDMKKTLLGSNSNSDGALSST